MTSSENRVICGPIASCHGPGANTRIFSWIPAGYEGGKGKEYVVVVSCWMGDSRAVARENYLQVTGADILRTVQGVDDRGSSNRGGAAQNPAQQAAVTACTGLHRA